MGTLITMVLIITAIVLPKRIRFTSPLVLAAAVGIALALFDDWRNTQESYAAPLISLGVCFLIYFADVLWSLRQIRHLSRKSPIEEAPPAAPAQTEVRRVYYDKNGIIGAGTSFDFFPLTIPIDKPLNADQEITDFTEAQLLGYVAERIRSQGVGDAQTHGKARSPASPNGDRSRTTTHFSYGLPYLSVEFVVAAPLPGARLWPLRRVSSSPRLTGSAAWPVKGGSPGIEILSGPGAAFGNATRSSIPKICIRQTMPIASSRSSS